MRVVVHDYPGHAFPAQLARALAGRGHDVLHLQLASFVAGKAESSGSRVTPPASTSSTSISAVSSRSTTFRVGSSTNVASAVS